MLLFYLYNLFTNNLQQNILTLRNAGVYNVILYIPVYESKIGNPQLFRNLRCF